VTPGELRKRIPEHELVIVTSRSSGPGGQNINKVNTKVEIRFNVIESPSLTDTEKNLILLRLKNRISKSGTLIIKSQSERNQLRNRERAILKIYQLLSQALSEDHERILTVPTRESVERRLNEKRKRSEIKKVRKYPDNIIEGN
jgi:ribosome-associated protein